MQSEIFKNEESDNYFLRNRTTRSFTADYIINIFGKKMLSNSLIAEFGIGGGSNLMLLSNYCTGVYGFDASKMAVDNFQQYCMSFYGDNCGEMAFNVNLCKPLDLGLKFDIVIFGFFAYYCSDDELEVAKCNALNMLNEKGFIFVYDFLTRENKSKKDSRNNNLNVYKRNINFWLDFFKDLDFIDYRLFDNRNLKRYLIKDKHTIDEDISPCDEDWNFGALFRK